MSEHNKLPSRAEIEKVIAGFTITHGNQKQMGRLEQYNFSRTQPDFEYSTDPSINPYANQCDLLAKLYQFHLSRSDVISFRVASYKTHMYLLLPYKTEDGNNAILICDPTAEQFFKDLKDPYFLGTKDELLALGDQLSTKKSIEEIYFTRLSLYRRYPKSFLPEDEIVRLPQDVLHLVSAFFHGEYLRHFNLEYPFSGYSFVEPHMYPTTTVTDNGTGISEVSKAARSTILPTTEQR